MVTNSRRAAAFLGICALMLAVGVGYVLLKPARSTSANTTANPAASAEALAAVTSVPHLLFRSTAYQDGTAGRMGVIALDRLTRPPLFTALSCERVHFAAGSGVCLTADRGMITTYRADLFDATFTVRHRVPLAGVPSRARMSHDGALAASTNFVSGDSYASAGFSTRTFITDTVRGQQLANLEEFEVTRDGRPFKNADFNFWGVTFAKEPGRFFATLATGGELYLVEGDAQKRSARVLRTGVECPSLSPDHRRIAFKKRMPGLRLLWRLHVLDLETGQETAVAEERSVDDQVEWLDDHTVLYALVNDVQSVLDIWAVSADGSGTPRVLLAGADSPAVVRPPSAVTATR